MDLLLNLLTLCLYVVTAIGLGFWWLSNRPGPWPRWIHYVTFPFVLGFLMAIAGVVDLWGFARYVWETIRGRRPIDWLQ